MSAGGAAARLRALPADATATEVLCAALGCDRRGLSSLPGGAARALASLMSKTADTGALGALCAELDEAETACIVAADGMRPGRLREAVLRMAADYDEIAHRVREAIGGRDD